VESGEGEGKEREQRERVNEAAGEEKELLKGNLFAGKIMVEWRSQKRDKVVPGAKQQVLVLTYAGAT
jgi:hypothetical protein